MKVVLFCFQCSGWWNSPFTYNSDKLLRISDLYPSSIEEALANYKILPKEEIPPAASFIKACLRLDSYERPSARELELHPWLKGAFCGWAIWHIYPTHCGHGFFPSGRFTRKNQVPNTSAKVNLKEESSSSFSLSTLNRIVQRVSYSKTWSSKFDWRIVYNSTNERNIYRATWSWCWIWKSFKKKLFCKLWCPSLFFKKLHIITSTRNWLTWTKTVSFLSMMCQIKEGIYTQCSLLVGNSVRGWWGCRRPPRQALRLLVMTTPQCLWSPIVMPTNKERDY